MLGGKQLKTLIPEWFYKWELTTTLSYIQLFQNSGDMLLLAYRRHHITCMAAIPDRFLLSGCALYNPLLF